MSEAPLVRQIANAVRGRDAKALLQLVEGKRQDVAVAAALGSLLSNAAGKNDVESMQLLFDAGVDVNWGPTAGWPEGALVEAARAGAHEAIVWLIDRGANVNQEVGGLRRCVAIAGAARQGDLPTVKLLLDLGADFNSDWKNENALTFAMMYGREEVVAFLRSIGATVPPASKMASVARPQ